MFGDSMDIERGDRLSCVCVDCGDRYTYIEKVDQDPSRSTSMCPDCYPKLEEIRGGMVAGSWRITDDDDVRGMFVELIESETPYSVYVKDRVGDLYVYDPEEMN